MNYSVNLENMKEEFILLNAKNGAKTAKIKGENGNWVTLASMYNPETEGKKFAEKINSVSKSNICVILGMGLGYMIPFIKDREMPIIIIEKNPQVFKTVLSLFDVVGKENLFIIVGKTPDEVLKKITEIQIKHSLADVTVIPNPSSISAFPSYYTYIERKIINYTSLKKELSYPKFKTEQLRILVFDSSYFTLRECINGFKNLGHKVETIKVQRKRANFEFLPQLLKTIINFKPDFIFTINHLGFDENGVLTGLLDSFKIPYAVWYVDSPTYILKNFKENVSEFAHIFSWEKRYIEHIKNFGFHRVNYLPLASDPALFNPNTSTKDIKLSFVGNSMVEPTKEWFTKIQNKEQIKSLIELAVKKQKENRGKLMTEILEELGYRVSHNNFFNLATALTWKATLEYRKEVLSEVQDMGLSIYGDKFWKTFFPQVKLYESVDYYTELPKIYKRSIINLNATSFQMPTACNQRVFDVACSGSFLITDYQESLEELFNIEEEIVCYKDKKEIKNIVKFYLNHSEIREKIERKARERVLSSHTYHHRIKKLVEEMRKNFDI